jgi:hypothetical protein
MPTDPSYTRLLLFFLVIIYSCSSSVNLSGNYSSSHSPHSFNLNKDSTFSYRYKFEFAYGYSKGTWSKIEGSKILLNSQIKSRVLIVNEHALGSIGSLDSPSYFSINVNIPNADRASYRCLIFVNDTLYGKASCDSLSPISIPTSIKDIYFGITAGVTIPARFLDTLYTEKMFPKSRTANKDKIDISYNDSLFNYRVFNNEILRISKKGLEFNDGKRTELLYNSKSKRN